MTPPSEKLSEKLPPNPEAVPSDSAAKIPTDAVVPVKVLSPEEQMALYEKDLKENDWGHQPC